MGYLRIASKDLRILLGFKLWDLRCCNTGSSNLEIWIKISFNLFGIKVELVILVLKIVSESWSFYHLLYHPLYCQQEQNDITFSIMELLNSHEIWMKMSFNLYGI